MSPHKLTFERVWFFSLKVFILVIVGVISAEISLSKTPSGGRLAVVVDERLAALRSTPELNGRLVRRLSRGRMVAIRGSRTREGVVFLLVNVTTRTHGWIQRDAVVSTTRVGDDRRLLDLINASDDGFERIVRARIFLDYFTRSPLRPRVLLLLSDAAEDQAAKLSRDAAQRLKNVARLRNPDVQHSDVADLPVPNSEFTYFMNYAGLDRYNRQRILFVFDRATKRFHYDGAALRELLRRYPHSPEAFAARKRLAQRAELKK